MLLAASVVFGQETSPTPGTVAETERVIVTGSNIPTAEEVGPNPVQIINRDFIDKSGEHTTEQLLRDLPIAGANATPLSNNSLGPTPGASSVSLRGFGESATLVLIDGRRVAPYPIGGTDSTKSFVDLNSIPAAAIDSIEILKDGASTTYGADAVAGVVNIKFRHDYRGAEATVEYGNTLDKDNGEFSSSLLFGAGDGNTNVSGVLSYYQRNSIFNRDRGYSNRPSSPSSSSNPGNFQVSSAAVIAAGGTPPPGAGDLFFASPPPFSNGLATASAYHYTPGRSSFFNFNLFSGTFPDIERYGGLVNFDHKVCARTTRHLWRHVLSERENAKRTCAVAYRKFRGDWFSDDRDPAPRARANSRRAELCGDGRFGRRF